MRAIAFILASFWLWERADHFFENDHRQAKVAALAAALFVAGLILAVLDA